MPCHCCNSSSEPPEGMRPWSEMDRHGTINHYLTRAVRLIEANLDNPALNSDEYKKKWAEAFVHHLWGCPEKEGIDVKD